MIWGQEVSGQEVGAEDGVVDGGYHKVVVKFAAIDEYVFVYAPEAVYVGAIGRAKRSPIRTLLEVLLSRGNHRHQCAAVHQPSSLVVLVLNEDEVPGFFLAGQGGIQVRLPACPFPGATLPLCLHPS